MKTCFFHVGPHKTGSSSIQKFFRFNHAAADENNLLWVSLTNGKKLPSKLFFPKQRDALVNGTDEGFLWGGLKQFIIGNHNLIISDERYSSQVADPTFLPQLKTLFADLGFELVLVSVHREQASHMNSSYVQGVKRFFIKEDIETYLTSNMSHLRFSYRQMKAIADAAGIEHRALSFEDALKHSTLGAEFVRTVGGDPATFVNKATVLSNPNPGVLAILAAERLRAAFPDVPNARVDNEAYKYFLHYLRKKGWQQNPYFGVSEARQKEIYDRFYEENDGFVRLVVGKSWDEVAPFRVKPVNMGTYEALTDAEREEVDFIVDKIVRKVANAPRRHIWAADEEDFDEED